jgi:hypothetical protein
MTFGQLSSPDAVIAAAMEYDELGRRKFLKKYGFGGASRYMAVYGDRLYDPKGLVADEEADPDEYVAV